MVTIKNVEKNTPAYKKGVRAGDALLAINGKRINDVLDYRFYAAAQTAVLSLERGGAAFDVTVKKGIYDDLGLGFESYLMDKKKACRNKCVFCFIDQNPPGMRKSLYFKDDDDRLSFLQGNYITLTNVSDSDIERIIKMKITPINVSVHTMNPALRVRLMGNRFAGEKLKYLFRLAEGGVGLNLQFVLCRGINDGDELEFSLSEIKKLKTLNSAAIVPAGLTKHRKRLFELLPYDKSSAAKVIDIVERHNEGYIKETGEGRVFCSDEFYLAAMRALPRAESYGDFPQYENGVGMLADLCETFRNTLEDLKGQTCPPGILHVVTGESAHPFISLLAEEFRGVFPERGIIVHKIKNTFYGETITVNGLLTGGDIINQLKGKISGTALICGSLLNSDGVFLDGVTPAEAEEKLGARLVFVKNSGESLCISFFSS
ncbi:MAG: DUF512 domain-containing protein [Eubacteriales bacterium]